MRSLFLLLATTLTLASGTATLAQEAPSLSDRIDTLRAAPDANGFELGTLLALRVVERLGQTQQAHGWTLARILSGPAGGRFGEAEPTRPETIREVSTALLADLEAVRATLEQAGAAPEPFVLDLRSLWFDLNANGERDRWEGAETVLGGIVLGRGFSPQGNTDAPLEIRFDAADALWLTGYTHAVSGLGNLVLAFDPEPVLTDLMAREASLSAAPSKPYFDDVEALHEARAALEAQLPEVKQRIAVLDERSRDVRARVASLGEAIKGASEQARPILEQERDALLETRREIGAESIAVRREERALRNEITAIWYKLPESERAGANLGVSRFAKMREQGLSTATALYVLIEALDQQPDAAHLQAARAHFRQVIALNRRFWPAIAAETDDDREWIPNATQTGPFGLILDPRAGESWLKVLEDAEAVLDGRLLVPHPLLPAEMGIDLDAYLADPAPLDLAGWIHGVSAYAYAATGPRITRQYWSAFGRMVQGRTGAYALYFN